MLEYKEEKKRIFFEGVEVASFYSRYPEVAGLDRINSFFSELSGNALEYFLTTLCERAREEYRNDMCEKKRFYFRRYSYVLSICAEKEREGELEVSLTASLCRGKKEEIARFCDSFCIDTSLQLIKAPHKQKKSRLKKNKQKIGASF